MTKVTEVLYLSRGDIESLSLPGSEIFKIIEKVLMEKGKGAWEMPPKIGVHPAAGGSIHAMPAFLPSSGAVGCKWISGYDVNPPRGLPRVSGLVVLNDVDTGLPISILDCTWITEKRTGAATAVAAKYLARESSSKLAVIGCGVQGWSNLEALVGSMPNITSVKAYDIVRKKAEAYVRRAKTMLGIEAYIAPSFLEAVKSADIVLTATPIQRDRRELVKRAWLEKGCFYAPLDYDTCWSGEALKCIDKFCTDDTDQLLECRKEGFFKDIPKVYAEIGEIILGSKAGRRNEVETTMAMNLGIGLEDVAVGMWVYGRARGAGVGRWLKL